MTGSFTVGGSGETLGGHERGKGPPLLLLHGGPGLSDYMDLLDGETGGWRTVTYQQRGLTPSTTTGPFTVARHAADAVAVLDGLGIDRATVVGHSWGSHLALQLAVSYPARVAGLVLIEPPGPTDDGGLVELALALDRSLTPEARASAETVAARLGGPDASDADGAESLVLRWPGYFADPRQAPPLLTDFRLSLACNAGTVGSLFESLDGDFAMSLRNVAAPAVFVVGAASPLRPHNGEQCAALMPNAVVDVVAGAGHLPWIEVPGCVAAALARLDDMAGAPGHTPV